jgi:hypothetical protein
VTKYTFLADHQGSGTFQIYKYTYDGMTGAKQVQQLTNDPTRDNWWPRIHPDGTKFLYCSTPAGTHDDEVTGTSQMLLRTCNMDGTGDVQVAGLPGTIGGTWTRYAHPEWNPDGTEVCVWAKVTTPGYGIYVLDSTLATWAIKGGANGLRHLESGANTAYDPSYHPVDKTLVFMVVTAGINAIRTVSSDTTTVTDTGLTVLVNNGAASNVSYDPYYSPDTPSGSATGYVYVHTVMAGTIGGSTPLGQWHIQRVAANASSGTFVDVIGGTDITTKPNFILLPRGRVPKNRDFAIMHGLRYGQEGGFRIFCAHLDSQSPAIERIYPPQTSPSSGPTTLYNGTTPQPVSYEYPSQVLIDDEGGQAPQSRIMHHLRYRPASATRPYFLSRVPRLHRKV